MINKIQIVVFKLFKVLLPYVDRIAYSKYFNQPFTRTPILNSEKYHELAISAEKNTYLVNDVDILEKKNGFAIDKDWIKKLALKTQIVVKKSELNYAHGRVLYCVLRKYLKTLDKNNTTVNIFETGTGRGFSSVCMAKALSDSQFEGSICTVDVLPHFKKILWNCIADHTDGAQTRDDLLRDWAELVERYIIFVQGFTRHVVPKIALTRINFAFLDGAHTYEDVMFEFNYISQRQKKGDIVVFDDYNVKNFPGIVKAIKHIESTNNYEIKLICNKHNLRDYAIAKKLV